MKAFLCRALPVACAAGASSAEGSGRAGSAAVALLGTGSSAAWFQRTVLMMQAGRTNQLTACVAVSLHPFLAAADAAGAADIAAAVSVWLAAVAQAELRWETARWGQGLAETCHAAPQAD